VSNMFDPRNGPRLKHSPREPKASEAAEAEWSLARVAARLKREGLSMKNGEDRERDS